MNTSKTALVALTLFVGSFATANADLELNYTKIVSVQIKPGSVVFQTSGLEGVTFSISKKDPLLTSAVLHAYAHRIPVNVFYQPDPKDPTAVATEIDFPKR